MHDNDNGKRLLVGGLSPWTISNNNNNNYSSIQCRSEIRKWNETVEIGVNLYKLIHWFITNLRIEDNALVYCGSSGAVAMQKVQDNFICIIKGENGK